MSVRSISHSIRRRELRAQVHLQLRALSARGFAIPAGAALVIHESTGRLIGFVPIEDQRAAALDAARAGLDVRELRADGIERHVVERYSIGGAS